LLTLRQVLEGKNEIEKYFKVLLKGIEVYEKLLEDKV